MFSDLSSFISAFTSTTARGRRIVLVSWSMSENASEDIWFYGTFSEWALKRLAARLPPPNETKYRLLSRTDWCGVFLNYGR